MRDDDYMNWWERTFKEREDALDEVFGPSHPPDSPEGYVLAMSPCGSSKDAVLIPGACAHVYPPGESGDSRLRLRRRHWAYATVGLSQPSGPEDTPWDEEGRGRRLSGHGVEFAALLAEPHSWVGTLLAELMGYHAKRSPLYVGHRLAGGFYAAHADKVSWFFGIPERDRVVPVDQTRAFLFWPMLGAPRWFTTETGNFELLCATNITADEWEYAKLTSSAHLQLLLCQAGHGQVMRVGRDSVLQMPNIRALADKICGSGRDAVSEMLQGVDPAAWL